MTASQQLNHISEQNYDDDITITDLAQGTFPAVTSNSIAPGNNTREIEVMIMSLEQSLGGTMSCNPGLFVRADDETAVKVTVKDTSGNELASNTTNYS